MFQLLKNPQFRFMNKGRAMLTLSAILVVISIGIITVRGINRGIEFTGGAELQVKYSAAPNLQDVRDSLRDAGLPNPVVTTIGDPGDHEITVRIALEPGSTEDLTAKIATALHGSPIDADLDLNIAGADAIAASLTAGAGLARTEAEQIAKQIADRRKEVAIFGSVDDLASIPGLDAAALGHLRQIGSCGPIAIRSQSFIGPAIGRELMNKAVMAIIGSLIGMLLYIWVRFQLQWGFAAVLALAHDTIITLGLFSLFQKELSLPVVAAFLTLVGYSVNDTVVVFDRIRENLSGRAAGDLSSTIDLSINQTLSRTVITSGLTWIVVFGLYVFGGSALKPFSFVLSVGVLIGTYSSIFIASPLLVLGRRLFRRSGGESAPAKGDAPRRARKVRSTTGGA